jgi:uncharacterized membrane protein
MLAKSINQSIMNFLAFIPLLSTIIGKIFPDPAQQDAARAQLLQVMANTDMAEMDAKSKVIVAESTGNKWQQNWRPALMYLFMTIIGFNYVLAPLLAIIGLHVAPLPIPENMWSLLEISVGGYVVGRSGEKMVNTYVRNK